ncbi:MAG: ATP-binding cassette domain-containing protein [Candidatus Heimdallarchaeota archaeon]|nr:ATP-binding cassette domain-containing protein [Candidatus Heimdallarchaeota archaeon]
MGFRGGGHFHALVEDEEMKERSRNISDRKLAKWVFSYLKDYKWLFIGAIVLVILSSLLSLISPQITKYLIDNAFGDNPTVSGDTQLLLYLCLVLLGVGIVTLIVEIFKTINLYKIGFHTVKKIRNDTFTHLQKLSLKYFDTHESGRIISKVTNDCDKINEIMSGGVVTSITDFITLIGIMIILLLMNWELALWCFLFSIPPVLIISYFFRKRARKAYRKTRKTIANVTANLSQSISGVKVSKSFTREDKNIKEFKEINLEDRKANIKAVAVFATTFPLFHFISSAVVAFVYFYGGWTLFYSSSTIHYVVSIGTAIAFTQYIGNFFRPILNLTMFYNTFQSTMAATERIYDLVHTTPAVQEKEDAYDLPPVRGEIKFKDVVFGYKEDELVLDHFNLKVQTGETLAIVGPTGAGKTTITNLLARFYEIQSGEITVDEHNIQDVTLNSLHQQMGIVLQDPYLFSGTIKENIAYGRKNVTFKEIKEVAEIVNAHEFIERMPNDYESPVGERGGRLSLGQRQLVSFARALLHDPQILILDEATSSVDPYTELLIKKALDHLLTGRTAFIIAHRLSTVRNADRIIVIKDGVIVEEGTNEELLAQRGEYYRLYQLQFKDQEAGG